MLEALCPYRVLSDNMVQETRVSGVGVQVSAIKKFQITNHKYQMVRQAVRQAHGPEQSRRTHNPEPSRRANHNDRSASGVPNDWLLILFEIWILRFGICLAQF